jgi:hypothetical protein
VLAIVKLVLGKLRLLFDRVNRMRNAIYWRAEEAFLVDCGRITARRRPLCGAACPCTE